VPLFPELLSGSLSVAASSMQPTLRDSPESVEVLRTARLASGRC